MFNPLHNRTAFVTGGSRGIGKAIAIALAEAGVSVAFSYHEKAVEAAEVAKKIQSLGGHAFPVQMDVRDRSQVKNAFNETEKVLSGIDILVNNAGINKPTDFDQITDDDWDNIMSVNLKGPFICSQEVLPYMRKRGGGSIIHIGSVSGQYGGPRTAHYATSKAGLISLGQVIARFGAKDNIRSNTVSLGLIESEMAAASMKSAAVSQVAENIVLKRLGTPEEVGKAVVFLASDDSSYITAQTINVNGGIYF
ncbi:MAG: 3-oxoacyl-ACP reductase FabG [Gammaproteobacteria bacterium]|nr:3-oxoacyl-ACP reductase FabG [Gammaproteobacteria bacterium]